jgi:alpha-beta hydrolase superfamily lysophospholipase
LTHEEGTLDGVGGLRLYRQAWLPDGDVKAVVVLSHGASEHSSRYAWVAGQLTAAGYALHALDHRGHGKSEGTRAYIDRLANAVTDLDGLVDVAAAQHPGVPLFLLGHSMGGCLAIAYALEHQDRLDGLLLSAPLAALEAAPLPLRIAGRVLSVIAPKTGVYQVDANGVSNDPAVVADYVQDPLNHHGKLAARTLGELAGAIGSFPARVGELTLPLLVMHGPDDKLVPYAGGEMVHAGAGSQDKTFIRYDGLAHELLNEPERQRVVDDITGWLNARAAARPAPAPARG